MLNRPDHHQEPENISPPERKGYEILPDNLRHTIDADGSIIPSAKKHGENQPTIMLTNRGFEMIDTMVSYKFLGMIIKKIKENPGRKVVVLDIGGGVKSRALRDMLSHPFLKGKIECINVDLFAAPIQENGLTVINENMANCPLPDESVDAIMSIQALNYMDDDEFFKTLEQIGRILKKGGEAYLDTDGTFARDERDAALYSFPQMYNIPTWIRSLWGRKAHYSMTLRVTNLHGETHVFGYSSPMLHIGKTYENGEPCYPNDFRLAFPEIIEAKKAYKS